MALTKDKKKEVVKNLKDVIKNSKTIVFANFEKLPVFEAIEIRRTLKSKNVGYVVAKKSLAEKAFADSGFEGGFPDLSGQLAIVYGTDDIEPARGVFDFEKKFESRVAISGGVFGRKYLDKAAMADIAKIPTRETLIAQFVNLINSPIQGLVIGLSKIAEKKPQ